MVRESGSMPAGAIDGMTARKIDTVEASPEAEEAVEYNTDDALTEIQEACLGSQNDHPSPDMRRLLTGRKIKEVIAATPQLREATDSDRRTIAVELAGEVSSKLEQGIKSLEQYRDQLVEKMKKPGAWSTSLPDQRRLEGLKDAIFEFSGLLGTVLMKKTYKTPEIIDEVDDADVVEVTDLDAEELDETDLVEVGEVGEEKEAILEGVTIDNAPERLKTLDAYINAGVMPLSVANETKAAIIEELQAATGWRLLSKGDQISPVEIYQRLTNPLSTEQEIRDTLDSLAKLYQETEGEVENLFVEAELAQEQGLITAAEAKKEKITALKGIESARGVNLSEAYKMLDADSLDFERLKTVIESAESSKQEQAERVVVRKKARMEAAYVTPAEADELLQSFEERAEGMGSEEYAAARQELLARVEIVDLGNLPGLLESGAITLDEARGLRDQLQAQYFERGQEVLIEANKAIILRENERNEQLRERIYTVVDQLHANGNLAFGSEAITKLNSRIEQALSDLSKKRIAYREIEGSAVDSRGLMGGVMERIRLARDKKAANAEMGAAQAEYDELLSHKNQLVTDMLQAVPRGVFAPGDVEQISSALGVRVEGEASVRGSYVSPEAAEAMRGIWQGDLTPVEGLAKIRVARGRLEKQLEATRVQEGQARDTGGLFRLVDRLYKGKIITFDSAYYRNMQRLARHANPQVAMDAKMQLLKLEGELRQAEQNPDYPQILEETARPPRQEKSGDLADLKVFGPEYKNNLPAIVSQVNMLYELNRLSFNGYVYQEAYRQAYRVEIGDLKGGRALKAADRFSRMQDEYLAARKKALQDKVMLDFNEELGANSA
ncbi:hypothetical protein KJ903_05220 [Patescibacteria group bacterium]|nr:hypothetical protein [Patescibacteria group bacterium]